MLKPADPSTNLLNKLKNAPTWVWWVAGGLTVFGFIGSSLSTDHSTAVGTPFESNPVWMTISFIIKLAVVILLIYMTMFLVQRWRGKMSLVSTSRISLLETFRLSPKQSLHLVKIGEEVLVIGASDAGISLLKSLDPESLELDAAELAETGKGSSFGNIFSQLSGNSK